MSNFAFRQAALAYNLILKFMQENTDATRPVTIRELEQMINAAHPGEVKGIQQILDATKKYHDAGLLKRIKPSGRENYWWAVKPGEENKAPDEALIDELASRHLKAPAPKVPAIDVSTSDDLPVGYKRPEITISKHQVLIVSEHIKITIEI